MPVVAPKAASSTIEGAATEAVSTSIQDISELIASKGAEIRDLKASKADKDVIKVSVNELLLLKERYSTSLRVIFFCFYPSRALHSFNSSFDLSTGFSHPVVASPTRHLNEHNVQ